MPQHLHILGICGTFMGGVALLAREMGYSVSGSDANVYPPMSTQLESAGIQLMEGYSSENLASRPDLVIIGNALSRGNAEVEAVLERGLPYISGPQWLGEALLADKWVLAVAGTHGKTTTTSLLAWILEYAGFSPGFLVGGVPANFGVSARRGDSDFFVIEADEYDTAFFDKRSKFVHYRPRTLVVGNLEFDHADIFPDLTAIETQFHHLIRCVPGGGKVLAPDVSAINRVLARGLWTPLERIGVDVPQEAALSHSATFRDTPTKNTLNGDAIPGDEMSGVSSADWTVRPLTPSGSEFEVLGPRGAHGRVAWPLIGRHNLANACAAIAAAANIGVSLEASCDALAKFRGVKRRLEWLGAPGSVAVYDDFAHHPTAIASTLEGFRASQPGGRIIAVIEPRSNTMRGGYHGDSLAQSVAAADRVFWYEPAGLEWSMQRMLENCSASSQVIDSLEGLLRAVVGAVGPGDSVIVMSNGGFDGFHQRLLAALEAPAATVPQP